MRAHVIAAAELTGGIYRIYADVNDFLTEEHLAFIERTVADTGVEPGCSYLFESCGEFTVIVGVGELRQYAFDLSPCIPVLAANTTITEVFVHVSNTLGMTDSVVGDYLGALFVGFENVYYILTSPQELVETAPVARSFDLDEALGILRNKKAQDTGFRLTQIIRERVVRFNDEAYTRSLGCYHPSSVAQSPCDRALAYERLGVVPRPIYAGFSYNYFEAGHVIHGILQGWLKDELGDDIEVEPRISIPSLHILGNADCAYRINNFISDIKTVGPTEYAELKKPRKKDVLQLTIYQLARACPNGSVIYAERDSIRRRELYCGYIQKNADIVVSRVADIEVGLQAGVLPERIEGECVDCKFKFCCKPRETGRR